MEGILRKVVAGYVEDKPTILHSPQDSIFHVIDLPNYRHTPPSKLIQLLPPFKMMEHLANGRVLVIRHDPNTEFDSFSAALDAITQRDQSLQIQGNACLSSQEVSF